MTSPAALARNGVAATAAAYLCWGVFGLYFNALSHVPVAEILAHRVLGGAAVAALLLGLSGGLGQAAGLWRRRGLLRALAGAAVALAVNWGLFIWAVANGRALEGSMGYFLFPLVSLLLGWLVLGERLTRRQAVAVAVVAAGVVWLAASGAGFPWVAVGVAASFGAYGLQRKLIDVSPLVGLLAETVLMAPLAIVYLLAVGGGVGVSSGDARTLALLAVAGPVTAVPLLLFAVGARRLRLTTLGLLMYINPTVQMAVAVLALGEPFSRTHAIAFAAIWSGLAIFSWPPGRQERVANRERSP